MSTQQGAHEHPREGRPEPETATIAALPPEHSPRHRRQLFPDGWRDVPYAALAALLVACIVLVLTLEWILLGRPR